MQRWKAYTRVSVGLILLLVSKGFMSSGIERITFEGLVRRSHAILLVQKDDPFIGEESIPYGGSVEGAFKAAVYSFKIVSIVRNPANLDFKQDIRVFLSNTEENLHDEKTVLEGGPSRMRIHPYYDSKNKEVERQDSFLIFVRYNSSSERLSLAASGAFEDKDYIDSLRHLEGKSFPKIKK